MRISCSRCLITILAKIAGDLGGGAGGRRCFSFFSGLGAISPVIFEDGTLWCSVETRFIFEDGTLWCSVETRFESNWFFMSGWSSTSRRMGSQFVSVLSSGISVRSRWPI